MMMMREVPWRRDWWFGELTYDEHYMLGHLVSVPQHGNNDYSSWQVTTNKLLTEYY